MSFPTSRRLSGLLLMLLTGGLLCLPVQAQTLRTESQKFTGINVGSNAEFANAIAMSSSTALVGSYGDDDQAADAGSVYVFEEQNGAWSQVDELVSSDLAADDGFGYAVSLSGTVAVIGAPSDDDNGDVSGSAYVFERQNGSWTQTAKLTASDAAQGDYFGYAVSISGTTIVVGANQLASGGDRAGVAYVFSFQNGAWTQTATITPDDADREDFFGSAVAIDGTTMVISSPGNDDAGESSGSAYVFEQQGSGWNQQAKLVASDGSFGHLFGTSVSVAGSVVIVGAPDADNFEGAAYVFEQQNSAWPETDKLTAPATLRSAVSAFGTTLSTTGTTVIVGDNFTNPETGESDGTGGAYLFEKDGAAWIQSATLTASDAAPFRLLGTSVGIAGDVVLVGAVDAMYAFNGVRTVSTDALAELPARVTLAQNYPNPFNPVTTISYGLPATMPVQLAVYDLMGREVAVLVDGTQQAGWHDLRFDAATLPSGLYLYRLRTGNQMVTGQMTLLK